MDIIYFEDFEPGQTYELGSRTLTREAVIAFAAEYDPQPFHLDEDAGRDSLFGALIASGWHTGATLMRLFALGLLNRTVSMGSPGIEELRWLQPVYPGDEVRGCSTVEAVRASSSRPQLGLVLLRNELTNQHGELVLRMRSWGMFGRRPAG